MEQARKKHWRRRAAAGVAAAAASAGLLVGNAFDTPADMLDAHAAVVDGVSAAEDAETRRARGGVVRRWVSTWPTAARALLGVPLWLAGWGVSSGAAALFRWVLTPLGGQILSWLIAALTAIAAGAVAAKVLFPNVPWRKLLNRRTLCLAIFAFALAGTLDTALTLLWKDYPPVGIWLRLLLGALAALTIILAARRRQKNDAPLPPRSVRTAVERRAMELADSVCSPPMQ